MNSGFTDTLIKIILIPIVIISVIAISPFLLLMSVLYLIYRYLLIFRFTFKWAKNGKNILFIHSNSPNWQQYIEENIIPKIDKKAVLLNWSERSKWEKKKPLEAKLLTHYGGSYEFNPMAIVFLPFGKVKIIRFFKAFKDYKHGNVALLKSKETELYELL